MPVLDSCIHFLLPLANLHIFSLLTSFPVNLTHRLPFQVLNPTPQTLIALLHQTKATNKLPPPTSRPTISGPDFSTHLDRDSTPKSIEAATQDVEALDALDDQGNEWVDFA